MQKPVVGSQHAALVAPVSPILPALSVYPAAVLHVWEEHVPFTVHPLSTNATSLPAHVAVGATRALVW